MPMNTWMIPKNKRNLSHIPGTLLTFLQVNKEDSWAGNRDLQAHFEKLLEKIGQKGGGNQYDPNGGGARTYEAQLDALGLIFWEQTKEKKTLRLTLAGEAILDGKNPTTILQHQLLKLQYPSPYSMRVNVNINREFKIRPFRFLMRLLLDNEIAYLDEDEIGEIILPYAKSSDDFEKIKGMLLNHRKTGKFEYPDSFMDDTYSTRGKNHTFEQRIQYLHDKANIFVNYLDSCHFILRPETKRIVCNPITSNLVEKYLNDNKQQLMDAPEDYIRFQRRFGLDPDHRKDTRLFDGTSTVSADSIKRRMVLVAFSNIASKKLCLTISGDIIGEIHTITGVSKDDIRCILSTKDIDGLNYFEENYIGMANRGRDDAIDFEKATMELFQIALGFKAKHIGQTKPKGRPGGNPDVIVISDEANYCGILDAKAYASYGLDHDHQNRMELDYIPNVSEHSEGKDLKFFAYISGDFSNKFSTKLRSLSYQITHKQDKEIHGSGITARNLVYLCQKARINHIPHDTLKELFSCDNIISIENIDEITA